MIPASLASSQVFYQYAMASLGRNIINHPYILAHYTVPTRDVKIVFFFKINYRLLKIDFC